ncbi:MAG: M23 family metallopeptidase [Epsilonproteobacteria bacterium]|nr:M23 family metallopeptidase [Campylobacterota bacterium]
MIRAVVFLWGSAVVLCADMLGYIDGVKLALPIKEMCIEEFIKCSIGHIPKAIVKDGLPHFGAKRDDWKSKTRVHQGYDIYVSHVDVVAAADGVIKTIAHGKLSGTYIKVLHQNGVETLYIHVNKVFVKEQERVKAGQVIAHIDKPAGNAVAPQLHFEIKRKEKMHLDPLVIIKNHYQDDQVLMDMIRSYEKQIPANIAHRDTLVKTYIQKRISP